MANNYNQNLNYRQIESDLAKSKIAKPPRNKKKERDISFYVTTTTLAAVTEKGVTKNISCALQKTLKLNSTTPLNFDIAKPKFADVSDTSTWGGQINGFIFEEIEWDPDKYSFITFTTMTQENKSLVFKYRIVSYDPVYDNSNTFIYASVSFVKETNKTIPDLNKVTWNLTNQLIIDKATKYIKYTFGPKLQLHPKGIKVQVTDSAGVDREPGITINQLSENLGYRLIRVRGVNPFIYDDLSIMMFEDGDPDGTDTGYGFYWRNDMGVFIPDEFPSGGDTITKNLINVHIGGTDVDGTHEANAKYFGYNLNVDMGAHTISQKEVLAEQFQQFIGGNVVFDGSVVPSDEDSLTTSSESKLPSQLNAANEADRKYFVISKLMDFTKFIIVNTWSHFYGINGNSVGRYKGVTNNGAGHLTRENEINKFSNNPEDNVVIETELAIAGKNPIITLETTGIKTVSITTYDENHNIILNDIQVELNYSFDNGKKKTVIQL